MDPAIVILYNVVFIEKLGQGTPTSQLKGSNNFIGGKKEFTKLYFNGENGEHYVHHNIY